MTHWERWSGPLVAVLLAACGGSDDGDGGGSDVQGDAQRDDLDGGGNGATSCVVFETSQLLCNDAPNGDIFNSIFSCETGDVCEAPSPYNVDRNEIECVDTYRYQREEYPATCTEVSEWYAGDRDCLLAWHCSSNEEVPGDWQCVETACVCPSGGFCPTPQPPGPDTGADAGSDAGPDGGGPGDTGDDGGIGLPDAGDPDAADDGDSGPPGPPGDN